MKSTPTLFQRAMVKAMLREVDPKTITRRPVKGITENMWIEESANGGFGVCYDGAPSCGTGVWEVTEHSHAIACPYGQPGDQLWVRETFFAFGRWETRFSAKKGRDEWHFVDMTLESGHAYLYAADEVGPPVSIRGRRDAGVTPGWWKRPAIFMPRAASRITLEITGVRVERLQDISEADARAEGLLYSTEHMGHWSGTGAAWFITPRDAYRNLWESINGPGSWAENPWVWVIEFKRLKGSAT